MSFLNPIMLAGLAAGLVPLILHLLNRSRYRNIDWGAMMFLDGVEPRRHLHSTRLKQWGLLALRSMILALLAVGLARPVIHARGLPPTFAGRTAAVLLLDRSASMALNDNGRVRLDLAREAVFQILSPGFHRGDDLWLATLGDGNPNAIARYASDPQEMARFVRDVTVTSGEADVAAGLRKAIELLIRAEAPNREIYLFCDRQSDSWRNVNEAFLRDWQQRLSRLPHAPRLFVVPVGSDDTDNVVVEAIEPLRQPLVTEQPVDIAVRLRNHGTVPRAAKQLTVEIRTVNGTRVARQLPVNLSADQATTVIVPVTFTQSGSNVITARIDAPGTLAENELHYSVEVLKDFKALIVDGDEGEGAFQGGADFLKLAIGPPPVSKRNTAVVTVVRPDAWGPADLRDYRVLVLANVPSVTDTQAEAIQRFVYGGGGLMIAPGDQTRVENYNQLLPWLPATLYAPIAESADGSTKIGSVELSHPIFRFLDGRSDPTPAVVRRYFPTKPKVGSLTLGSYSNGRPFLFERILGRGRILLMTIPADADWSVLPLTHFFLPFAQSAVRYVAAGPLVDSAIKRNVVLGRPILADFDEPLDARNVVITGPQGRADPSSFAVSQFGITSQVRYTGAQVPGIYKVSPHKDVDAQTVQFVVRTPPAESDLTVLPRERWQWLERELSVERIDPQGGSLAASQEAFRSGIELWLPFLGAVIVLSVVELSATRRWAGRPHE